MRRRIIALATAAVLVAMAVGVQEAGAVTAGFVRVATPNPPIPDGRLRATDCIGDWCMAVGYGNGASGGHVAIAGSLNGGKGTIRDGAAPANATDSVLAGVSCVSTKWCTAVGSLTSSTGEGAPFSEQWDGTAWTVVPIPSAAGATSSNLYSVSCVSQSFCIAVGVASYPTVPNQRGFVAAWNGTTWTEQPTPVPFPNGTWDFESVSCTSTTFCELIGNGYANGSRTVAERWDGQAWSLQTMAQPNNPHLMSVSCVSPSWCVASGMYDTLIEQWDGVAWTIPSVPPAMDQVRSVSCTSMTAKRALLRSLARGRATHMILPSYSGILAS